MALKPTIYKADLNLSDIDRNHFASYSLTLALHPSENLERMTARLLAFAFNAHEHLSFSRGLSSTDEPALWQLSLDERIEHWIDVGEPAPDRLRKASGRAEKVSVYAFAPSAETWWQLNAAAIAEFDKVDVFRFQPEGVKALAEAWQRTNNFDITITENIAYCSVGDVSVQVPCDVFSVPEN